MTREARCEYCQGCDGDGCVCPCHSKQTIYTQINHEGCEGCMNVTYEAGSDSLQMECNHCGAAMGAK